MSDFDASDLSRIRDKIALYKGRLGLRAEDNAEWRLTMPPIRVEMLADAYEQATLANREYAASVESLTSDLKRAEQRLAEVTAERDEARKQRDRADRNGTWRTLHGSTIEEIAAERDTARAQLAKMKPVYEAAVKMKETDEAYCELGEGVTATPKAVHDAVVDLYVAIDALPSPAVNGGDDE